MVYHNVLLLKKKLRTLKPEETCFLQNCNMHYQGQYTNPNTFFSHAVNNYVNIVIFDPSDYTDLDSIVQVLCCLQDFCACYVILYKDIPNEYKENLKIVETNPYITEPILKISDALLRIEKRERECPNVQVQKAYTKIQRILNEIGIDGSKKGFSYLCDAIYYVYTKPTNNIKLLKDVYVYVAEKNRTTDMRVERDMRYALSQGGLNCDLQKLKTDPMLRNFYETMKYPTAKQVITAVVNFLKYNTVF